MLTSREWHLMNSEFDEVLVAVTPGLPALSARHLHEWFAAGEQGFGMDLLIWALLAHRLPMSARIHGLVSHILTEMGPLPGRILPCLSDPAGVIALLDRQGEPLRNRGLPPQRGGHTHAAQRGAVTFPLDWSDRDIRRAGDLVLDTPEVARLANGRAWRVSVVDRVAVGALATRDGELRAVVPEAASGTRPSTRPYADREHPTPVELVTVVVGGHCTGLRKALRPTDDEAETLRQLDLAAEYDELADALVARADQEWPDLDPDVRGRARLLLRSFDLPVEGCAHLNDRDATLERWAA